jgi:hypothetical protein
MDFTDIAIVAAIIAAVLAQALTSFVRYLEGQRQSALVRKVIIQDMIRLQSTLLRLRGNYIALALQFKKADTDFYRSTAFQDLHTEVYEGIEKVELYRAFKEGMIDVVKVYNVVGFLRAHTPYLVYQEFAKEWEDHATSEAHKSHWTGVPSPTHYKCPEFFAIHQKHETNCRLHVRTAKDISRTITALINYYG